jgi:1-acyl-sn-glycerol-3-phosphate acyltransferase
MGSGESGKKAFPDSPLPIPYSPILQGCLMDRDRRTREARLRFAALWVSQVARVTADNALRVFVVLEAARGTVGERDAAWHLVSALLALPAVLLAPVNGAIPNSLPRRGVLAGAAAYCTTVVALFGLLGGPWPLGWGLVALGIVVYSPARYAVLPAVAEDSRIPLPRVNGWIEMGATGAAVAGLLAGGWLHGQTHLGGIPAAVVLAVGLNAVGLLAALFVSFPSDVRRAEPFGLAVRGFFTDCRRVWREPTARATLVGLAALRGVVVAMTGAVVACALGRSSDAFLDLLRVGGWILLGMAAGSLLAGVQGHPRRSLGLVPFGTTGLAAGLCAAALLSGDAVPAWLCVAVGAMGGLVNVPLAAAYQEAVPADARGNAMAVRNAAEYLAMTVLAGALFGLARAQWVTPAGQLWLVAGAALIGAAAAWRLLFVPAVEQFAEIVLWPFYRIRARGPGADRVPRRGPVLVIANHSAYFDPLWLGKVVPRRLTPMMTALFFDKQPLRWLMVNIVGAIRVEAATYRREVPELDEAVTTLDRGGCLVIFPEAQLRRREDQLLRQFGQGVWRILRDRPQTPVVACWIEGGWGSYLSYKGGPPFKNKRLDFWRRIDVAVGEPQPLDPALLADQRATRAYLMQLCLDCRKYLGLSPATGTDEGIGSGE